MIKLVKKSCAYCSGTGKVANKAVAGLWSKCVACDGYRFVFVAESAIQCEECGGTGKKATTPEVLEPYRCQRCRGKGWSEPKAALDKTVPHYRKERLSRK